MRLIAVLQTCMSSSVHPGLLSFPAWLHSLVSSCQINLGWLAELPGCPHWAVSMLVASCIALGREARYLLILTRAGQLLSMPN